MQLTYVLNNVFNVSVDCGLLFQLVNDLAIVELKSNDSTIIGLSVRKQFKKSSYENQSNEAQKHTQLVIMSV